MPWVRDPRKPARHSPEQRTYLLQRMREAAEASQEQRGKPLTRNWFLAHEKKKHGGLGANAVDIIDCGDFSSLMAELGLPQNGSGPRAADHPQGPWDDETDPGFELPTEAVPAGAEVRKVTTQVDGDGNVTGQSIQAVPEQARGEVLDQLLDGHRVKGVSTLVGGDGSVRAQWVKTDREEETRADTIERWVAVLEDRVTVRSSMVEPPDPRAPDLLAVYPIGDHHCGMLSWKPETGHSYDLRIASQLLRAAFDELTSAGPEADTALLINLGDFYHADNAENRTPQSKHALDVDGRLPKVFGTGVEILIYAIDRALEAHREVIVWNLPGNHDPTLSVCLSVALQLHYKSEPRVTIEPTAAAAYFHRFGACLFGAVHGDGAKPARLPGLMAQTVPEDWGQSRHRYFFRGHVHHRELKELDGVEVESFQTLAPPDAWHAKEGYLSGRSLHRLAFHREHGRIGRSEISAEYLESRLEQ